MIKAIEAPNVQIFLTQTIYEELEENFKKEKLKKYRYQYENFKTSLLDEFIFLKNVDIKITDEDLISGQKDREIYRTATVNNIDIIVTGDKPFLEFGVSNVQIINPKSFIQKSI